MVKIIKLVAIPVICLMLCGSPVGAEESIPAESVLPESIKISVSDTMLVGETQKIKVSVLPTIASGYELEYLSSDETVLRAAIGSVIASAEGKADITVRVKGTDIFNTVTISVVKTKDIAVTDIELYDDEIYIELYDEKKIFYDILPDNAANKHVKFTSMNTSVATVTDAGVVYGKRNGNAKIKVESADGNVVKYIYVTVSNYEDYYNSDESDIAVRSVSIYDGEYEVKKRIELMRTQTKQFTVQIYPESATDKQIRWKSQDESIAEVDENGVVKGVSEGTVKIFAIARDNGRQDIITINVIPYVRYPDNIIITPPENAVFETGQTIKFTPSFKPEDTTERNIHWVVSGGCATIDSNGNVTVTDRGTVTVKAYSSDWKQSSVYEFQSSYSKDHFVSIGSAYNVRQNRAIILSFDSNVNINSAKNNIFAGTDENGNENLADINIEVAGNKVIVMPVTAWKVGENYLFVKENLCDIYGNRLGKSIKYFMKVRGVDNEEA